MRIVNQFYLFSLAIGLLAASFTFAQTSYTEDFSGNVLPSNFASNGVYKQTVANQELKVVVNKTDDGFKGMYIGLSPFLNLSAVKDRTVSFDIRTDTTTRNVPYTLFVQFFAAGNKVPGSYYFTVFPTGKYRTYSFNFTNSNNWDGSDFTSISGMQIVFQPPYGFNATAYIDNIKVGSSAIATPYFKGIENQSAYINSSEKTVKILQITDGTSLTNNVSFTAKSSNPALIPDPTFVNAIVVSNTRLSNGYFGGSNAYLKYTPATNQFGIATITVTATSTTSVSGQSLTPSYSIFSIVVNKNIAPVIDAINGVNAGSGIQNTVNLAGLSDGNPEITQMITITGTSSDQAVIKDQNIQVEYDGTASFGKLKFTPESFASLPSKPVTITLTLNDGGGTAAGGVQTFQLPIAVDVFPAYYKAPTFDKIYDNLSNVYTSGIHTITLTGITDGNGGNNVASLAATSSNAAVVLNPSINYVAGANKAVLTYNVYSLGTATISVTATNTGAPSNSNGNSWFTRSFELGGINPPVNGFIEPFTATSVLGFGSGEPGFLNWIASTDGNTKWDVESQGDQQIVSINSVTGVFTNIMNKGSMYNTGYYNGVWYRPAPGSLYNFKSFPYLSVTLSANVVPSPVAIDLFDVNGKRFGLSSTQSITSTPNNYTFCYTGQPSDPSFDISKVERILFNFGAVGHGTAYNGTVTLKDLNIGDKALNTGNCPVPNTNIAFDSVGTRYFLTSQAGPQSITLTGINAGFSPINGQNNNAVGLSVIANGAAINTVAVSNVQNGVAILSFNTIGSPGTGIISITGTATAANQFKTKFTVNVVALPSTSVNASITNDINVNMPDGQKGQSIDGFGATINGDVGGNQGTGKYQNPAPNPMVEWGVRDMEMTFARMAIPPDFEPVNDNDNPNAMNKSAFDYGALKVDLYNAYAAAGVTKFIGTMWSVPSWTKYNGSYQIISNFYSFVTDNTIDTNYVNEVAEFAVAYVLALKERTGIEMYAFDFVNEPQFNEPYASAMIDKYQYVAILRAIGRRFKQEKLKTILFGAETLPAQDGGNDYLKQIQNDPEVRDYLNAYAIHNYDGSGAAPSNPTWSGVLTQVRDTRSNAAAQRYYDNPLTPANSIGNGSTGIPAWQTETSGYPANWSGALNYAIAIHNGLFFGNVGGWTFWTFDDGDPKGAFGLVGGNFVKPIYHAQKHFSKYIKAGARRIPGLLPSNSGILMTAYQNPDESVAMVIINDNSVVTSLSISGTNLPAAFKAFQSSDKNYFQPLPQVSGLIILPPKSITTLWGNVTIISVAGVSITGNNTISTAGGTQQFNSIIEPIDATDKSINWSVTNQTGSATINSAGLLTATSNGTVLVRAESVNNPLAFATSVVTISAVNGLTISGQGGVSEISVDGGNLQMEAIFNPTDAINKNITWSVAPTLASISGTGLLTAKINGIVTVTAISQSNTALNATTLITLSNQTTQLISVTGVTITMSGGNIFTVDDQTKIINSTVLPTNATDKNLAWSATPNNVVLINSASNPVSIQAIRNGVVTLTASSVQDPTKFAVTIITVSGQVVPVDSFIITALGTTISTNDGTLQLQPVFSPSDATNQNIIWVSSDNSIATVTNGLITAVRNGIITIAGTSVDDALATSNYVVTITNQYIEVTALSITGAATRIATKGGTLQLQALISPSDAANKTVSWSISQSSIASVSGTGLVYTYGYGANNTVTVTATSLDVPSISKTYSVSILNQKQVSILGTDMITAGAEATYVGLLLPTDPTNEKVKFSVVPDSLASIDTDSGLLTTFADFPGIVTITGSTLEFGSDFKVVSIVGTLGITNFNTKISIYPNPTQGQIQLKINQILTNGRLNLQNVLGETILSESFYSDSKSIDLSSYPKGLYHLLIVGDGKVFKGKVVVK